MWNHILSMWNHILCGQLTFEFPVVSNRIFAHELHEWGTSHRDHKYVAWWYWEVHHINNTLNLQSSWVCQPSLFSSQKFVLRSETLPSLLLCPPFLYSVIPFSLRVYQVQHDSGEIIFSFFIAFDSLLLLIIMLLTWLQLWQYSTPVSYSRHIPFFFRSTAHLGLELFPLAEWKEGALESGSLVFSEVRGF